MIEFVSEKDLDCVFRHHSVCSVSQRNTCDFVFLFTFTPRSRHVRSRRIVETFYFLSFSFRCVRGRTSTRKELGRVYSSDWRRGKESRSPPRTTISGISRNVRCKSTLIKKIRRVCATLNKLFAVLRGQSQLHLFSETFEKFVGKNRWLIWIVSLILSIDAHGV